ncbi:hypothetical protein QFZ75_008127 [Streptomyces sp. V3I8]|uniref:hypothetical protein n=1 Tax=Streptomyces sp. V3I8 TaxID=3042279 RepID=UPI002787CE4D|nr:hypothetical protein [Streptomyces sp. V3I8]MDQ1041625.1 hypothetical protein [Streptomyces sp. V3I8]
MTSQPSVSRCRCPATSRRKRLYPDAREQAEQARTTEASALEAQCDGLEEDALLLALGNARARREAADREIGQRPDSRRVRPPVAPHLS